MRIELKPGDRFALSQEVSGIPPATIVHREDGSYVVERLTPDLRGVRQEPISEQEALNWIEASCDTT